MTDEEAEKIASIIATADGGCFVCVGELAEQLNEAFPEFVWTPGERDVVTVTRALETAASSPASPQPRP